MAQDELSELLGGSPSTSPPGTPPADGGVVGPSPDAGGPSQTSEGFPYYSPENPPPRVAEKHTGSWHGRELYDEELKDPGRRMRLFNRLAMECGNCKTEDKQRVLETFFNRGVSRGQSVDEVIDDLNYFPGRIKNQRLTPEQLNEYEGVLKDVRAGSNLAKYGTGNASYDPKTRKWVGFAGGPRTATGSGEDTGTEKPDIGWSGMPDEPFQSAFVRPGDRPVGAMAPMLTGAEPGAFKSLAAKPEAAPDELSTLLGQPQGKQAPAQASVVPEEVSSALSVLNPSAPDWMKNMSGGIAANVSDFLGLQSYVVENLFRTAMGKDVDWSQPGTMQNFLRQGWEALGVHAQSYDAQSTAGEAGRNIAWGALGMAAFTGMASYFAKMAAQGVSGEVGPMANVAWNKTAGFFQDYLDAVAKYPAASVLQEMGAQIGSTYLGRAGEEISPSAGVFGRVGGAIVGGISTTGASWAAKKLVSGLGRLSRLVGIPQAAEAIGEKVVPTPGKAPPPTSDQVDRKELIEKELDGVGDLVRDYATHMRNFPASEQTKQEFSALREHEKALQQEANQLERQMPAWARRLTPLRPSWAKPEAIRGYAEGQVKGQMQQFEDQIVGLFNSLKSDEPAAVIATKFNKGLEAAEEYAGNVVKAYWERTPKKAPVPADGLQQNLQQLKTTLADRGTDDRFIPQKDMDRLEAIIAKGTPTVEQLRSFAQGVRIDRIGRDFQGNMKPKELQANMTALEQMVYKAIGDALPDDATIAQARAVTRKYHQLFDRSVLGDLLATGPRGTDKVWPQNSVQHLLNRFPGLQHLVTMSKDTELWRPLPGQADAYPFANPKDLGPEGQQAVQGLVRQAEQSIKQQLVEDVQATGAPPDAVTRGIAAVRNKDIGALPRLQVELDHVFTGIVRNKAARDEVEQSALAKFTRMDSQTAIRQALSHPDSERVMGDLVASLRGDFDAHEGLKAGIIDELLRMAGAEKDAGLSTTRLKEILGLPKMQRTLAQAFTLNERTDLDRLVHTADLMDREMLKTTAQKHATAIRLIARISGAHLGGITHKVGHFIGRVATLGFWGGKGGEIQIPAIMSKRVSDWAEQRFLKDWKPGQLLHEAIRNPEFAKILLDKLPNDAAGLEMTKGRAQKMIRQMEGLHQNMLRYFQQYAPTGGTPPTKEQRSEVDASTAHALLTNGPDISQHLTTVTKTVPGEENPGDTGLQDFVSKFLPGPKPLPPVQYSMGGIRG